MIRFFTAVLMLCWATYPVWSQTGMETYLKLWQNEQMDQLENLLPELKSKFPKAPESIFLQTVFERDGAGAAEVYEMLLTKHPENRLADACLFRLIQFDYARAAYETAHQRYQVLKNEFPKSIYIGKAETMFAGLSTEVTITPGHTESPTSDGRYRLQVGAFGTVKNAEDLRSRLQSAGYTVEFSEKTVNRQRLTLVWVGPYSSRDEAAKAGAELKEKLQLNFTIVEK